MLFTHELGSINLEGSELGKLSKNMEKITDLSILDKPIAKEINEIKGCPIEGNGGRWSGERGNSMWLPYLDEVPKNKLTNPDELSWKMILDKYEIQGIEFVKGKPDFTSVSKGTVEIDHFTENRVGKGGNFDQACEKLAQQKGYEKSEIKAWMLEHRYTWHESSDCKTLLKVPTEVHGNIYHVGGISEIKSKNKQENNISFI